MSDISVVGLGAMGTALAIALIKAGRDVTVWNRSREKMEPLMARGALAAPNMNCRDVALSDIKSQ